MLRSNRSDLLRYTLLGVLGTPLVAAACGGTAFTTPDADADSDSSVDGDADGGDGDTSADADTGGDGDTAGDGDSPGTGGWGDGGNVPLCTNPAELAGGFVRCDEGYTHRVTTDACPSSLPRPDIIDLSGACTDVSTGCCTQDADCTQPNQYCTLAAGNEAPWPYCVTGCTVDTDCGAGMICLCGDPIGQCVAATCTTDADCEGDLRCASTEFDNGCGPVTQFSCQSLLDECVGDAHCAEGEACAVLTDRRQCQPEFIGCVIGRPFLVEEQVRVAPLMQRLDWCEEIHLEAQHISSEVRVALASDWTRAAQMEHASIGAFARFSLQLLSLGAPVSLIEQTNQALMDETRHARMCFGVASAYAGRKLGPGVLNVENALSDQSLEGIVTTAILEGCIGETVAALSAAEAASATEDARISAILTQIADDESRHAELAWAFVRWALSEHPSLRATIESVFARALTEETLGEKRAENELSLEAYGVLSESTRALVRRSALQNVVVPCVTQLLAAQPFAAQQPATEHLSTQLDAAEACARA